MMKNLNKSQNKELHDVATKVFMEVVKTFQLMHTDIECLTYGENCKVKDKNKLGKIIDSCYDFYSISVAKRKAEMLSNHPVHLLEENGNISQSAFIPFCEFGGDSAVMGKKIDQFVTPVCNSFRPKILQNQLCYEVDLNQYKSFRNIDNQIKKGFLFLYDNNEDKESFKEIFCKQFNIFKIDFFFFEFSSSYISLMDKTSKYLF